MFGIDDALLIGGITSLASGLLSAGGQAQANRTNVELADKQMRFQERMSSTSYQRGVKDMRAAGINPMLAYAQGGASSPVGAMAHVEDVVGPAVGSARQGFQMVQEMKRLKADTRLTANLADKSEAEKQIANENWRAIRARNNSELYMGPGDREMSHQTDADIVSTRSSARAAAAGAAIQEAEAPAAKLRGTKGYAVTQDVLRAILGGAGMVGGGAGLYAAKRLSQMPVRRGR